MTTDNHLMNIPAATLAVVLLSKVKELYGPGNRLTSEAFELYKAMTPVCCIDGIPWRVGSNGTIELMALRRLTDPYPGKLVLIGGTIAKNESLRVALKRYFREDFKIEIDMPEDSLTTNQYRREDPNEQWLQDPGKDHVIAPVYLVHICGETPSRSVQGDPIEWISESSMNDEDFGYTNHKLYRKAFRALS